MQMAVTLSKRLMSKIMSNVCYVKQCRHCQLTAPYYWTLEDV